MNKTNSSKVEQMRFVLEKLITLHRGLIGLLEEEHSHMIQLDVKGLVEAAHAKEVFLAQIVEHENLRMKITEEVMNDLGLTDPTLANISEKLPDKEEQKRLLLIRDTLNELILRAKEVNARNMGFASSSIERIEFMKKNVLGLGNTSNENYSQSGSLNPITEQGGRLLTTEA